MKEIQFQIIEHHGNIVPHSNNTLVGIEMNFCKKATLKARAILSNHIDVFLNEWNYTKFYSPIIFVANRNTSDITSDVSHNTNKIIFPNPFQN